MNPADRAASLKRLSALKYHPRELRANQEITEAFNELFAMHLGADRDHISGLLAEFLVALNTQDEKIIPKAQKRAQEAIDALRKSYVR